ncbi:hypothetical protein [Sulfidibacter corallicola]|uniref:Uncharacterized protein n=1 Tax=Sulfidibacter corallicola TaxID=2818388 RepID=A0A8A4TKP7_SULCO|nr:hypothetical protein [Sulfidibacter corallicola]QTD49408.1 hypothetical protein J3U87_27805 [Sulfidibacter corallicola]
MSQGMRLFLLPKYRLSFFEKDLIDKFGFRNSVSNFDGHDCTLCYYNNETFMNIGQLAQPLNSVEDAREWDWIDVSVRCKLKNNFNVISFDYNKQQLARKIIKFFLVHILDDKGDLSQCIFDNDYGILISAQDIFDRWSISPEWDWRRSSLPELPGKPSVGD